MRTTLRDERGSFLLEIMVTVTILSVLLVAVLGAIDRASARGNQTKARATASDLAQAEHERLRSLPISVLSNYAETLPPKIVNGRSYTVTSRAEWQTDETATSNCATSGRDADFLRLTTTVTSTSLQDAKPTQLDSILAPPARSFGPDTGAVVVQVKNANDQPVQNLSMTLSGPDPLENVSGVTNEQGCILWGYLPITTPAKKYRLQASVNGWVTPAGDPAIDMQNIDVVGEQTKPLVMYYDQGGTLESHFYSKPGSQSNNYTASKPEIFYYTHNGPPAISKTAGVTDDLGRTPLLFPFASQYTLYAGGCTSAAPPTPTKLIVVRGQNYHAPDDIQLPALDLVVKNSTGGAVQNAKVVVSTNCGQKYTRFTGSNGRLQDPGFPYSSTMTVCVSATISGVDKRISRSEANTTFPSRDVTFQFLSASTTTDNGAACT